VIAFHLTKAWIEEGPSPKRAFYPQQMAAWYRSLRDRVGQYINGDTKAM
jgi:hypothetical protein